MPCPGRCSAATGCEFSFSGLKTAVAQLVARYPPGPLPRRDAADIAAGFQAAVADVLADRAAHALAMMPAARLLVVAGGVAANRSGAGGARSGRRDGRAWPLVAPPPRLCTDNAVMVAWAGIERLRAGLRATDSMSRHARAGRSTSSPPA